MDLILLNSKDTELKGDTPFWRKRLLKATKKYNEGEDIEISFLCGRKSYRFRVEGILHRHYGRWIDDVLYESHWEIKIGEIIDTNILPNDG